MCGMIVELSKCVVQLVQPGPRVKAALLRSLALALEISPIRT